MIMKIKKIYNFVKGHESQIPMLSSASFPFWTGYVNNHTDFDNIFARTYANFEYFNPLLDGDETEHEVAMALRNDVENYLLLHKKRFEEMFRIQGLEDADLPMTYNYDMKETMSKTTADEAATITGKRTDIDNLQVGNQKSADVNKVTAFNSNNENTNNTSSSEIGTRNDIRQFTKGQETDTSRGTGTENYTLERKGNIGVQTGADILMGFDKAMPVFEFYSRIFSEICENFLLIGGGHD